MSESRILIIFPGALGDLICLLPTIRAISAQNPGCSVELMARMELARFAVGRMGIARAHSIDRPEVGHLFATSDVDLAAARRFFGEFVRIDAFFAADNDRFRASLRAIASDVRFYPFRPPSEGHVSSGYLKVIGADEAFAREAGIEILDEDRAAAAANLERGGLRPGAYLLVLPGSGSRSKNWPADNFLNLIRRFEKEQKTLVVLGPAEADIEAVFRDSGVATCTGLELGEVAALARASRVFIGNDSGVSHLAAAAGARGLVLFGPSDPVRWRPQGRVEVIRHQPIVELAVHEVEAALRSMLCDGQNSA